MKERAAEALEKQRAGDTQVSCYLQLQDKDQKRNMVKDILQQLLQQWLLSCSAENNNCLHSTSVLRASRDRLIDRI